MISIWRGWLLAIALLASSITVLAQAQESLTLIPSTSEGYGYASVVPEGWTDVGNGIFARQRDAADTTLIAQQSAPLPADALLTSLLPQLGLSEPPASVGEHQGGSLTWTLYRVDVPFGSGSIAVDLALAEQTGVTYLVLVQTSPEEEATLQDALFLPALDAFAPLAASEEPVPYLVEDVHFVNGDVTLAGTLTLPTTPGPHPAVVLVTGSGPQDRDETLGGGIAIKPFRLLADALTRAGVAVLRYDDRGVGQSTGDYASATISDFASDAEAAIHYLGGRDEIDPARIGLLGHSEGGLVAAMLGARHEGLAFIISLAGPGVSGRDVLRLQNRRVMEAEGASQEQIDAQLAFIDQLMTRVDDPKAMEELIYQTTLDQAKLLPPEERAKLGDLEQYARSVARLAAEQTSSAWFASFLNYDPGPDWARTTVPVLGVFGGKDTQVDAAQNAPAMLAALLNGGNHDVEVVVLPEANHLFQRAMTGGPSEYTTLPAEFTPDLLPAIISWLDRHVTAPVLPPATPVAGTPSAATPVAAMPIMATPVA
jgi:pimeloyl-ACP methyl ester carboxylesterase